MRYWESAVTKHLDNLNQFASAWRLDIPQRSGDLSAYSNTRTSETTRATETLATMMFRMITSQDPNFELYPMRDDVTDDHLYRISSVIHTQDRRTFHRRKLLRAIRGLCLFGTQPVEIPWWMEMANGQVQFEATDFVPTSLLQLAFDPTVPEIKISDYHTKMDFISAARLRKMAKSSPGVWDQQAIENAISECRDMDKVNRRVKERLQAAGYSLTDSKTLLMTTRWGIGEDGSEMCWTIINERHVVRYHENPYAHGKRPFLFSSMIDFELEPYGYGVGNLGRRQQSELDANRNRNNDLMTFSQFNMWKTTRTSGLRSKSLKIRPFQVIELDDITSLESLRPSLDGLKAGLEHEDRLKEDFRAVTGATTNLQAANTDATATEASITQNEAVRRVAVMSEIVGDEFVRERLDLCIKNNAQFLDQPLWVNMTGEGSPTLVFPDSLRKEVGIEIKITTDKDFRPERTRRMIEYLQILSSVRQQIPDNVDIVPIVKELTRSFGIDPKKVIKPVTAFDQMMSAAKEAQMLAGKVPNQGSIQNTDGGPMGNTSTVSTPVGDIAGSPQ